MKRKIHICFLSAMFFISVLMNAQHHVLFFSPGDNLVRTHSTISLSAGQIQPNFLIEDIFLPRNNFQKPFFCSLEDKICEQLNIWVKFRAGSDEIYRRQTALPFYHIPKKED